MQRRAEFRPFGWLHDLWKRDQLELDPPYQRRSVWNEKFRSDFSTTVLLNYPCPAIFLYEEICADGTFRYKVVDGKQRLTTLFDFVSDRFPVAEDFPRPAIQGVYFNDLDDDTKRAVWRYSFSVEFVQQENEAEINDIFNRINKNVAKLTPQELRHAKFSGSFIQSCERFASEMDMKLPMRFPNIAPQSKRQMKDVEFVASLMLFLEQGERSTSQADLDTAFSERDEDWPRKMEVEEVYSFIMDFICAISDAPTGNTISASRLKNQADFYSLFCAIAELYKDRALPDAEVVKTRLTSWLEELKVAEDSDQNTEGNIIAQEYLAAARAASNDSGPRRKRIDTLKSIISDQS